jgi:DNA integrity scanning protein DisA with diadenylate cyclase activity
VRDIKRVDIAISKNHVPIRLTEERWFHIIENHDDLAGHYDNVLQTVEDPDYVVEGYEWALVALRRVSKSKFLAVVYREISKMDGFVITAYFTSKLSLEKEVILWQKK